MALAQKDVEVVRAELENVSQESQEKVAAAQAKITDAEVKVKESVKQQQKADRDVELANMDIKLADVRLKSIEAKAAFKTGQGLDSLLLAIRAGHKLRELDRGIWTRNDTESKVVASLHQSVYGVKEKNRIQNIPSVSCLSFSPDGKMIAIGTFDNIAKLWSLDGREMQTLRGHSDGIISRPVGK